MPLDIGGEVTSLAMGSTFTCALLLNGAVRCWGSGQFGGFGWRRKERGRRARGDATAGPRARRYGRRRRRRWLSCLRAHVGDEGRALLGLRRLRPARLRRHRDNRRRARGGRRLGRHPRSVRF
ncbi:MAG: hypothetical protein H6713_42965 [Myxococcales bacterium]|nr:hypothetical protein [Myxococcales bacterium]